MRNICLWSEKNTHWILQEINKLLTLNKKAILVPTPGQPEQEYLANYHHKQSNFYTQTQSEFNLKKCTFIDFSIVISV